MIPLSLLAEKIEDALNTPLNLEALSFGYGDGSIQYKFHIVADTTDFKRPTREENTVTAYIHGILSQSSSNIATSKGGISNITANTLLEIAVPVFDGMDEEGNKELVEKVRGILDAYFSTNGTGSASDDSGKPFNYIFFYNLATSGLRQALLHLGDAFIFRVSQSWVFMENGIESDDISLKIEGVEVPFTTIGLMRSAVQETDVPSTSTKAVGKNVTASTMLTINVGMNAISGSIFDRVRSYILLGSLAPFAVSLTIAGTFETYSMTFNEASLNGEIPLYASATFKLVEAM